MSKRSNADPLVKAFLDDYKLNLLKIPRQDAQVGDAYADNGGSITGPGRLSSLLVPKLKMPKIKTGEKLTNLATTKTRAIELSSGIGLLQGFFSAVGATGIASKIKASYAHKGAGLVRFRLLNATRDSVDPFSLGKAIAECQLDVKNPFVQDGNKYYVTVGVIRSPSITVTAEDSNSNNLTVEAGALKDAVSVGGKISVKNETTGELTYEAAEPLAFGVELVEMTYDRDLQSFTMKGLTGAVEIRGQPESIETVLVGDTENGDVFLNLTA
jgi:hypothetical protein